LKKALLVFDDPGGGLVVSSLIEELKKTGLFEMEIYSGKLSEQFVNSYSYKKIESQITESKAEEIISEIAPDILITATGSGNAEQEFRNIAFRKNIKSIVILDFWKDYKRRWKYATYEIGKMKDKICVMDNAVKEEMISDGFPGENIIVTGHPYLDKIFNKENLYPGIINSEKSLRNRILFLSQPLNIIGVTDYEIHPLEILLEAIKKLSEVRNEIYTITIKPHPSEIKLKELEFISEKYKNDLTEIRFADAGEDVKNLIYNSETVIGYNTIAMFEARALNKRTISLNVVKVNDSLTKAMQTAGIEITDVKKEEIFILLNETEAVEIIPNIYKGGRENCVQVILNELNLN